MRFAGFTRFSLSDFPNMASAIVFTQGCNFNCTYCHNKQTWAYGAPAQISEHEILDYLTTARRLIEGIVITGGEPTIHSELIPFIRRLKNIGFKIKLDTNGSNPHVLDDLLRDKLVDYVAMDLKAPLDDYKSVCNIEVDTANIKKSISLIRQSAIACEFRTTVCYEHHDSNDLMKISSYIKNHSLFLQQEIAQNGTATTTKGIDLQAICDSINQKGGNCAVR